MDTHLTDFHSLLFIEQYIIYSYKGHMIIVNIDVQYLKKPLRFNVQKSLIQILNQLFY